MAALFTNTLIILSRFECDVMGLSLYVRSAYWRILLSFIIFLSEFLNHALRCSGFHHANYNNLLCLPATCALTKIFFELRWGVSSWVKPRWKSYCQSLSFVEIFVPLSSAFDINWTAWDKLVAIKASEMFTDFISKQIEAYTAGLS